MRLRSSAQAHKKNGQVVRTSRLGSHLKLRRARVIVSSLINMDPSADNGNDHCVLDSVRKDVAFLEEYTWRWMNHLKMLDTIAQTNIDPKEVQRWKHQINECFRAKLSAKL